MKTNSCKVELDFPLETKLFDEALAKLGDRETKHFHDIVEQKLLDLKDGDFGTESWESNLSFVFKRITTEVNTAERGDVILNIIDKEPCVIVNAIQQGAQTLVFSALQLVRICLELCFRESSDISNGFFSKEAHPLTTVLDSFSSNSSNPWEHRQESLMSVSILQVQNAKVWKVPHCWGTIEQEMVSNDETISMSWRLAIFRVCLFLVSNSPQVCSLATAGRTPSTFFSRLWIIVLSGLSEQRDPQREIVYSMVSSSVDSEDNSDNPATWDGLVPETALLLKRILQRSDEMFEVSRGARAISGCVWLCMQSNGTLPALARNTLANLAIIDLLEPLAAQMKETADGDSVIGAIHSIALIAGMGGLLDAAQEAAVSDTHQLALLLPVYAQGALQDALPDPWPHGAVPFDQVSSRDTAPAQVVHALQELATIPAESALQSWLDQKLETSACSDMAHRAEAAFQCISILMHKVTNDSSPTPLPTRLHWSWEVECSFFITAVSWARVPSHIPWSDPKASQAALDSIRAVGGALGGGGPGDALALLETFVRNRLDKLIRVLHPLLAKGSWLSANWTHALAFLAISSVAQRPLLTSDTLASVLSVLLPMCEHLDWRISRPSLGAMAHVAGEVLPTELRWHKVLVLGMLDKCLASRGNETVANTVACLDTVLCHIEPLDPRPTLNSEHHRYLNKLLDDLVFSTDPLRSTQLLFGIRQISERMGQELLTRIGKILSVVCEGIGHGTTSVRMNALLTLEILMRHCWLHFPKYADVVGGSMLRGYLICLTGEKQEDRLENGSNPSVEQNQQVLLKIEELLGGFVRLCPPDGPERTCLCENIRKIVKSAEQGAWSRHSDRLQQLLRVVEESSVAANATALEDIPTVLQSE